MGQKHEQLHISILIISLLLASTLAGCAGQKETNGVVAILTDFGAQDYYVGAIKGTVLATYPQAQVMVAAAEIPAFDVHQAAVTLLFTAQEFPPGTVFLAIVDPGGGAEQRTIAMKTANGQFFIAPDNGLLTLVEQELGATAIHAITNPEWTQPPRRDFVFPWRDIYPPSAAHLAAGKPIADAGPAVDDLVHLAIQPAHQEGNRATGTMLSIDRFGNIQTNIPGEIMDALGLSIGDSARVTAGDKTLDAKFVHLYGDVPKGDPLVFVGGPGFVEVAINWGNAAEDLGAQVEMPLTIEAIR